MNESTGKQTDNCDELQKAKDLYDKVKRITEKGRDARVKRKNQGKLYHKKKKQNKPKSKNASGTPAHCGRGPERPRRLSYHSGNLHTPFGD